MDEETQTGSSQAAGVTRGVRKLARDWADLFRATVAGWRGDRAPSMGAAIAYYTVFSLAPILVLIVAIAGLVFGKRAAEGALFEEIAGLVGHESAGAVQAMLKSASSTKSGIVATAVGIGALLLAATGVFGELQAAFNVIFKTGAAKGKGVWNMVKIRLRSLLLIMMIGLLLMFSLALSTALAAFSTYLNGIVPGLSTILHILNMTISFGLTMVLFGMMFKVLPDAPVEWRDVWIGAAVTAFLFTVGKHFISLYVGQSGIRSAYHAAGALVLILVWIYYSAQILLFGAEFAKACHDRRRAKEVGSG